jgi:hypothetical protein
VLNIDYWLFFWNKYIPKAIIAKQSACPVVNTLSTKCSAGETLKNSIPNLITPYKIRNKLRKLFCAQGLSLIGHRTKNIIAPSPRASYS